MDQINFQANKTSSSNVSESGCLSQDMDFWASLLQQNNGYLSQLLLTVINSDSIQKFLNTDSQYNKTDNKELMNPKNNQEASVETSQIQTNLKYLIVDSKVPKDGVEVVAENDVMTPTEDDHRDANSEPGSNNTKTSSTRMMKESCRARVRKDVVYKTILRSIRRFYSKLFKTENPRRTRKSSQRPKISDQIENMEDFCKKVFPNSAENKTLTYFVMIMVNQKLFESSVRSGGVPSKIKHQAQEMYECLYNFKMGKFRKVARNKYLKTLLSHMLSKGKDAVIQSEKAMVESPSTYLNAFDGILGLK